MFSHRRSSQAVRSREILLPPKGPTFPPPEKPSFKVYTLCSFMEKVYTRLHKTGLKLDEFFELFLLPNLLAQRFSVV